MSILPRWVRTLSAAAALAVAVLAPSLVAAHPGHAHAPQVPAVQAPAHPPAIGFEQDAVGKTTMHELTSVQATSAGTPDNSACTDRGCCTNGACNACFSIVAPVVTMAFPPSAGSILQARDGLARAMLAIEGPKRPPKHFA